MQPRRVACLVGAVLVVAALSIALPPWRAPRETVRLGAGIALLGLAAGAAGVAMALSLRRTWARALVAAATGVAMLWAGGVAFAFATVPTFPDVVVEWTRLPDEANATTIDASLLPADLWSPMGKAAVGETGDVPLSTAQWNPARAAQERLGIAFADLPHGYSVRVDGRAFTLAYGPTP